MDLSYLFGDNLLLLNNIFELVFFLFALALQQFFTLDIAIEKVLGGGEGGPERFPLILFTKDYFKILYPRSLLAAQVFSL